MRPIQLAAALLTTAGLAQAAVITVPHAEVTYEGAAPKWAQAMAETIAAARTVYVDDFACDMPDKIRGQLTIKAGQPTRLFTDGSDRLFLSLPSESKLARPSRSGTFNLYGICHELGHMAMYRVLKDRDWMTGDAAEGWAHYAGSVVTDRVFALKGEGLWPDRYDYRTDGVARLNRQLASPSPDGVTIAAGEWQKLVTQIGQDGVVKLFAAWQAADINPARPAEALLATAIKRFPDKKDGLTEWWLTAAKSFVKKTEASDFKPSTIAVSRLTGKPRVLAFDDDQSDGRKSIAGGGHARRFAAPPAGEWYIRAVSVCGGQYGRARNATFDVALCDKNLKAIASWKKPYNAFKFGNPRWTRLAVTPTRVPQDFYICLNFRPTASQGVFVAFDTSTKGNSLVGIPGEKGSDFNQGDWMIRVELDRPKDAASQPAE